MESEYLVQRNAPLEQTEIESLRAAVGWDRMEGKYESILKRVYTHYSVRSNGDLIGFMSVLSDGVGDAFLLDLMVRPNCQKRGIGTLLVRRAILDLKAEGIRAIQVTFNPELELFYKRFGFHMFRAGIIDNETIEVNLDEIPATVTVRRSERRA